MVSGLGFDGFPPRLRWTEYKLSDPAKVLYEYWATGKDDFPLDMLRHDQAWPASGDDAVKLVKRPTGADYRSVKMHSHMKPTVERWSSFGWPVGTDRLT